ncbi:MAG: M56 family metallopeptidase [Aurantibacter sp.]
MEAFFIYFIKSSGVILLFLACYKFFLSRETFYIGNRYFLFLGLILAIVLPLISYTKTVWIDIPSVDVPLVDSIVPETTDKVVNKIGWSSILFMIYAVGILYGTVRLLLQLLSLRGIMRKSQMVDKGNFRVFESNKPIQPFSFFNHIIYHPESHSQEDKRAIVAHEKIHVKQHHSIDILLVHLFTIFQWCNPFIYFYKFYLKENLEFIADAKTLSKEVQKENYQYLLLKSSYGDKHLPFVNPFFNSSIKKRIVMLNQEKSKKRKSIKYGLVLPLLIGFVLVFNVETVAKIRTNAPSTISSEQDVRLINPKVYSISKEASDEEIEALRKEIEEEKGALTIENLKRNSKGHIITISMTFKAKEGGYVTGNYSADDEINSIYFGINYKGGLFITSNERELITIKTGKIPDAIKQDFSRADIYSIHKNTTDKELKKIKSTIEKKGGEFSYTHKRNSKGEIIDLELEIKSGGTGRFKSEPPFERCYFGSFHDGGIFVADDEKSFNQLKKRNKKNSNGLGKNIKKAKNNKFNEVVYDKDKSGDFPLMLGSYNAPLYLVNGVETPIRTLSFISPADIESMTVLKNNQSTNIYGEKGKNGVIVIKTKDSIYPYLNDLKPSTSVFNFGANSDSIKTSQPKLNDYLKVPSLIRVGSNEIEDSSEESPWKVSAGLSPKNMDRMSAPELLGFYQRQNPNSFQQDLDRALIIVDGKEMSKKDFDKIPADEIESMHVLKGDSAEKKYGKKGIHGVIEISLKKKGAAAIKEIQRNPLIVIDGKESSNQHLEDLDRDKIKSINVLKNKQATKKYGEKAKDGAVEIITKKD